jgi:hypothetical protein
MRGAGHEPRFLAIFSVGELVGALDARPPMGTGVFL